MESSVWQLIVRVVGYLLSLLPSLKNLVALPNGGASSNAPANAVASTLTSSSAISQPQDLLQIKRNPSRATTEALFGDMVFDGNRICFTMERKAVAIPEGIYQGYKRWSRHFEMTVVGIDVPNREDIECHPADFPAQVAGCVAVGLEAHDDRLYNSKSAFDSMMAVLPSQFTVVVS
jgi:hypothetical protein